ncbi:MAG: hypothetical protein KDD72_03200 [Anaerolineales bacterium]|nr:hypothetical protein [Anaerolineales bacterium]
MKKYTRVIILFMALLALAFTVNAAIDRLNIPVETSAGSNDDIQKVRYNGETHLLKINYKSGGSDTFTLDPDALETEVFRVKGVDSHSYLRFFSPALYESYGQSSQGIIILTRVDPANLKFDPHNDIALNFPEAEQPTAIDLGFAMIQNYLENHNKVGTGIPLCTADTADGILSGVSSSTCYVECQGKAEVTAQYLPTTTRTVIMGSRSENLEDGYIFLWSELHATVEIFSNNEWYVADPTYGFAYVKDATGRRLNVRDLIDALENQNAADLTFGLVHNGVIYDVPGDIAAQANTALAGIYYTSDKQLVYSIKSGSIFR